MRRTAHLALLTVLALPLACDDASDNPRTGTQNTPSPNLPPNERPTRDPQRSVEVEPALAPKNERGGPKRPGDEAADRDAPRAPGSDEDKSAPRPDPAMPGSAPDGSSNDAPRAPGGTP